MTPEHSATDAPVRFTPQLVVGLIVIAVGVVMTLDNLQVIDASRYLRFWPGALMILGVVKIWHSRDGMGGAFGGFLFVVIGAWLLLEQTALVHISFWDMWPALLVAFGVFLVWQGASTPRRRIVCRVERPDQRHRRARRGIPGQQFAGVSRRRADGGDGRLRARSPARGY